ncbi:hypothetical protein B0H14DRAFT_2616158 [Mycena olivaceomarginata]|nr:hypothetical protein B0H14DRAFT_2616158 [Mycena olivaceomarginata]
MTTSGSHTEQRRQVWAQAIPRNLRDWARAMYMYHAIAAEGEEEEESGEEGEREGGGGREAKRVFINWFINTYSKWPENWVFGSVSPHLLLEGEITHQRTTDTIPGARVRGNLVNILSLGEKARACQIPVPLARNHSHGWSDTAWSQFHTDTPESEPSGATLPLANARGSDQAAVLSHMMFTCLAAHSEKGLVPNSRKTAMCSARPTGSEIASNNSDFRQQL